jgi:hypothetical protein
VDIYSVYEGRPQTARVQCKWRIALRRGDWHVRVETRSVMTADAKSFRVTNYVDAYEGAVRIFGSKRDKIIPRDGV